MWFTSYICGAALAGGVAAGVHWSAIATRDSRARHHIRDVDLAGAGRVQSRARVLDRIVFIAVAYLIVVPVAFGLLEPVIARMLAPDPIAKAAQVGWLPSLRSIVGPGRLAAALDRLSSVNALKRDTSVKWDRKVGHPGMAIRIARLQARELAAVPDAAP
jgi:hypothetical protein